MPPKSAHRNGLAAAATVTFPTWDDLQAEALEDVEPYKLPISADEVLTIQCPSSDAMTALGHAQRTGDENAAAVALFGEENAARVLELAGPKPFVVLAKLTDKVLGYYQTGGKNLGD
jgi:hypothetical protein